MGLVQKSFSDIITFSRSSNATRVGPTGVLEYAPHNLLLQSQTLDNASWTKNAASVIANAATAPDGTVTADMLIPTASAGIAPAAYQGITAGLVTYTWSVYAKAAGYTWLMLKAQDVTAGTCPTWFNLSTGVIGSTTSGNINTITSVGNGWYRCTVTRVVSNASAFMNIQVANADNVSTMTGDGTSGIYIWGAQLAVGPYALDYVPTTSAAVYGPRFDYDPTTLAARGLLVEESRSNLVTYSEQFDNAAWAAFSTDGSVTANAATSPDGTTDADLFIPNTSIALHRVAQSLSTSSGTFAVSCYIKASGYSRAFIFVNGPNQSAVFDLANQTVTADTRFAAAPSNMAITSVGNGWYRCSFATNISSSIAHVQVNVLNATANPGDSWAGNGTSGIYIWGAQLEAGSFATSYIPTIASTVTRTADVASVNTLSPWMNQTEGTIFAEYSFYGADAAFNNTAVMLTDGTENNYEALFSYTPAYGWVQSGGATSAGLTTGGATAINTNYKSALAFKANDFAFSINGASPATDTSGTVPTVTEMLLGRRVASSKPLHGHLRRVAFFPRRLSNAELQALTS